MWVSKVRLQEFCKIRKRCTLVLTVDLYIIHVDVTSLLDDEVQSVVEIVVQVGEVLVDVVLEWTQKDCLDSHALLVV